MKKDIIDKALIKILAKKEEAERPFNDAQNRLEKDENFRKLQKKYTTLMIETAKKEAYGENVNNTEVENLQKEMQKYYRSMNVYPPKYACPLCHDTGYTNGNMCNCLKREISHILWQESNFGSLVTFDEARNSAPEHLKPVYDKMRQWCHGDFKKNLIFISGEVGAGKTYLTKAIAYELIESGKIVKLTSAFNMSRDFKEYRSNYNEAILDKYLSCEFLFIDDLGTETLYKNTTVELLYHVINERKTKKLCTIITSNLDLADLRDRYEERIYSRIVDRKSSITLYLSGKDLRIKK